MHDEEARYHDIGQSWEIEFTEKVPQGQAAIIMAYALPESG